MLLEQPRREHRVDRAHDGDDRADQRPAAVAQQIGVGDRDPERGRSASPNSRTSHEEQEAPLPDGFVSHRASSRSTRRPARARRAGVSATAMRARRRPVRRRHDSPSRRRSPPRRPPRAMPMSKLVSPTTTVRLRRRARLGHRRQRHRRMRLGRMPVGGLQRDEAGVDAVAVEAMLEARDRTCRSRPPAASRRPRAHRAARRCRRTSGSSTSPARRASRRSFACRSRPARMLIGRPSGHQRRHRLDQAEPDHLAG